MWCPACKTLNCQCAWLPLMSAAQVRACLFCKQLCASRPGTAARQLLSAGQVAAGRCVATFPALPPLQAGTRAGADSALLKGAQQQAAALKQSLEVSEHLAETRAAELLAMQEKVFATEQQLAAAQSQGGLDRQALESSRRQLEVLQVGLQALEGLRALRARRSSSSRRSCRCSRWGCGVKQGGQQVDCWCPSQVACLACPGWPMVLRLHQGGAPCCISEGQTSSGECNICRQGPKTSTSLRCSLLRQAACCSFCECSVPHLQGDG